VISLPRYIDRAVCSYLKTQIESGEPTRTKRALQEISKLYRRGWRFLQDQLIGIELEIVGLLMSSDDAKVRRWALNTLAQLGRESSCKSAILHALHAYHADAEVLAAAIAALYRLCKEAVIELRKMGFNEQTMTLAALQHVPAAKLDLSCLPLRVDQADAELVKLGLIIVGLDRAPPHLFEPNHDNATMVRAVGAHHDPGVSQYSVWAITENPSLGVVDLGIDLKGIEQFPANVRAWVFQLLAIDSARTDTHMDYIKLGIEDKSAEARLGLAVGLRDSFSPTLVPLVLEWFTREMDGEIRPQLLDHLIRQAERSDAYTQHALDAFDRGNADERDRMLAMAASSPLFSRFSAIKYNGGNDLFRGATIVNNKSISIGNIQAGAVAIDGDATQTGTVTNTYNAQTLEIIQSRLAEAEREIKSSPVDVEARKEALLTIEVAKKEPTKDNLVKTVTALGKVESLATKALGAGTAIAGIAHLLAQAVGLAG
jgi:hypothetical protein